VAPPPTAPRASPTPRPGRRSARPQRGVGRRKEVVCEPPGLGRHRKSPSEPILPPETPRVPAVRRQPPTGSMINAPHEGPLGMRGQREGYLEQHVVQPLRGAWLRLELWDLGGV